MKILSFLLFAVSAYLWYSARIGDVMNIPTMFEAMAVFISGWGVLITSQIQGIKGAKTTMTTKFHTINNEDGDGDEDKENDMVVKAGLVILFVSIVIGAAFYLKA